MEKIMRVLETLNNLKYIKRTGPTLFAGIHTNQTESIAEHSFKVANLVILLGNIVENINVSNIVIHAITHDWQESIIGDIPTNSRSYKQYFEEDIRQVFKKAEAKAKEELLSDANVVLPELNKTENELLTLCDAVAIIMELIDYKQKGNSHNWIQKMFDVQIMIIQGYSFDFVNELVQQLKDLYKHGMDNYYLTKATSTST